MKQTSTVGTICLIFVKTKRGREAEDDDDKKGTRTTKQYRQASKHALLIMKKNILLLPLFLTCETQTRKGRRELEHGMSE